MNMAPQKNNSPPKKTTTQTSGGNPASTGFAFADPQFGPDDYANFTTAQKQADANLGMVNNPPLQPIPALRINPPVMSLSDVVPAAVLGAYQNYLTFHMVGDTGGIKEPSHQFLVADKMVEDFSPAPLARAEDRPAFFFSPGRRGLLLRPGRNIIMTSFTIRIEIIPAPSLPFRGIT